MFKKHLVRLLACATGKIAFNKQCLVLVGGQDAGKSTFVRFLCPPAWKEYYTEEIDFDNKDGWFALAQNVFINLDELRNLSRQDINKVKSFISKDHVKGRMPFDRRTTKFKRKATFFGSTNNAEFLTDETGNVRWLVLEILDIQHDNGDAKGYARNVDIDLVYSQAFALMQSGFDCQLTKEEKQQSEAYNQAHTKRPIEYELILKFYEPGDSKADFKTASDIKRYLETRTSQKIASVESIGRALRMLGMERVSKKVLGQTVYGYNLKEEVEEKDWAKLADETAEEAPPF
jgi:predicted P-loop ATPase